MNARLQPTVLKGDSGVAVILTPTADKNLAVAFRSRDNHLFRVGSVLDPHSGNPGIELVKPISAASTQLLQDALALRIANS